MAQMKISEIKALTKERFTKCWAEAAFITVLQLAVFLLFYVLIILLGRFTGAHTSNTLMPDFKAYPPAFIFSVAALLLAGHLITTPLVFGIKWYYWQASAGLFMPVSTVFGCFSSADSIKRCIKMQLIVDLKEVVIICAGGAVIAPAAFLAEKLHSMTAEGTLSYIFVTAGFWAAVIITVMICMTVSLRYVPLGYIMAEDPDMGAAEITELSRKRMSGKYIRMMELYCSFTLWYVMSAFVFPLLPLIPYLYMSTAVFIRFCGDKNAAAAEERESIAVG